MELNGERMPLAWMGAHLDGDDRVTFFSPGGGGLGPAGERDPALVAADVANGLLDPDVARDVYGYDSATAVAQHAA